METFAPPRGMRDFFPEDWRARRALFEAWERAARLWGFETYDAPVVETLELLERKAGEEIAEQIYVFADKSGRRLALRPELTPSLARMIIARQGSLVFPAKWSAIAQCFRYERMTRGRKREHYQWNLDIVGEPSVMAETEVVGAAVAALRQLGLTAHDFQVRVGSRALLAELITHSGISGDNVMACYLALDKRAKIGDEAVVRLMSEQGIDRREIDAVFDLTAIETLDELAGRLDGDRSGVREMQSLFAQAELMGFAEFLRLDLGIVRGLGYYTGIVFEAFDTARKLRSIFGGGRYDNLLSDLGGQTMPCVGLGFGDVVVMELLQDVGKTPHGKRSIAFAVGYMDVSCRDLALRIAAVLRGGGRECDLALGAEKPRKFFSRADKSGASSAIYIGPQEAASKSFEIKAMASGEVARATLESLGEQV